MRPNFWGDNADLKSVDTNFISTVCLNFEATPHFEKYCKNPRIARGFFLNFRVQNFGPVLYADPKTFRPEFTVLVSVSAFGGAIIIIMCLRTSTLGSVSGVGALVLETYRTGVQQWPLQSLGAHHDDHNFL